MSYINSYKDQNWLLPPSIKQMIPENHICFLVEEFIESLDFSEFDLISEGPGHPSYHPRILMKILLQGMLSKVRSSRKVSGATRENLVFMYLAEKIQPNFRTICRFRRQNASFIKEAFKETIELASSHDLIDLSLICTDGTTMKANANKNKSLKKEHVEKLDSIIEKMIEEDIKQDELDKEFYGNNEENITNLENKNFKELVKNYRKQKDKKKLREVCEKTKEEFQKDPEMKRASLTDPECRMMKNKKGNSELSYNAQFTVDSKKQIIVANDVCQDRTDMNQLEPQVKNVKGNLELKKDTKFGADCGYNSTENLKFLEEEQLDGYIPNVTQAQKLSGRNQTVKQDDYEYDWKKNEIIVGKTRLKYHATWKHKGEKRQHTYKSEDGLIVKRVPEFFQARLRMKKKMDSEIGKKVYVLRKTTVEPVIGNIKENLGLREFSLRGLEKVRIELNLVSIAHNLKKVWLARGLICDYNKKFVFCVVYTEDYLAIVGQPVKGGYLVQRLGVCMSLMLMVNC